MRLQPSPRGCDAEATRCNQAGDTAWAPRCSAGRTAGSAGPRRRNAQLRWAMRGQDPLKEQRVPGSAGLLGDRTPEPQAKRSSVSLRSEEHTSELQSLAFLVCRLLLEKKKNITNTM